MSTGKTNGKKHPAGFRDYKNVDKAPGLKTKAKKEKVLRDLKGKKTDIDPSQKSDRPLKTTR